MEVVDDRLIEREEKENVRVLRVGVICGGPSAERGISLNSARSVLDHIQVKLFFTTELHVVSFNFCLDSKKIVEIDSKKIVVSFEF